MKKNYSKKEHSIKTKLRLAYLLFFIGISLTNAQTYTSGSGSWVCPAGVTSIKLEAWGAGGGGGYATANKGAGGGGGGGEYTYSTLTVVPGTTYYYRVGNGGAGGTTGGTAAINGQSSCFSTAANCGGTILASANGGNAGSGVASNASGVAGAGGTGGTSTSGGTFRGGNGASGINGNAAGSGGGGGGGGASTSGAGGDASGKTRGTGTSIGGGNGGSGASDSDGASGSVIGGGGAGGHSSGTSHAGGAGANGQITITIPLSNDNCTGAIALTVNPPSTCTTTTSGTTIGATQSQASCAGTADDDVWYSFTAIGTTHTITVTPGTISDIVFQVFSGACAATVTGSLGCQDSTSGTASETRTLTGLTIGNTYLVRVHSNGNGSGQGTFTICVNAPPTNDDCSGAIPLTVNTSCSYSTYTNAFATSSSGIAAPTCSTFSGGDVWFSAVVPASGEVTIDTQIGVMDDSEIQIFTGTCGALTQIACDADSSANGYMASVTVTGQTPGATIYIRLWEYGNNNNGTFGICASTRSACTTPTAQPTAIVLTPSSGTVNGSFTAASPAPSNYLVVYNTTGTAPTAVDGTTYTVGGAITGGTIADIDTNTTFSVTGLTSNTTYYFFVYSYNNSSCAGGPKYFTTSPLTGNATTPLTYCASTSTSSSYYINNFSTTLGSTNITNNGSGYSATGYGNFTAQTVTQQQSASVNFSVATYNGTHTYGINIWVDWNNDGDFSDTGEKVYASGAYISSATGTITVPGTASIGNHRMRIVANYSSTNPSDCGSISSGETEDYTFQVVAPVPCSGTPTAGTTSVSPVIGIPGSTYTVSATGYNNSTGLTFQWQYSTNGGSTWTNAGASSSSYSNYTATAPASGTAVLWQLTVTCTNSGLSAASSSSTFTSVSTQNIPATGNNTITCGTNTILYDNGGAAGSYANDSTGYTVLDAGLGATITISGNYTTESGIDFIRIYNGTGDGGTELASYSGTGTINYTGTVGQTLTIKFYSDFSDTDSGFSLSVSYSGNCYPACAGTPTGGTVTTTQNWPGNPYTITATGYTQASNLTYQWQFSTNAGATWTNAGASSNVYSNYTATAPLSGTVLWRLAVTCTNSSITSTSATGTFTPMVISDVVTGCPNVVSGGLNLNGADPAPITCNTGSCVDLEATYLDLGNTTNYTVEPIQYNPPFAFNGLANPVSVNTDDVWSPIVNLPFNFCFYGNTFNKCLIGSNGILTFDLTNNSPGGTCEWSMYDATGSNLPVSGHNALVENSIFGVFQDINPANTGQVGWELITLPTGCRALVVSWYNVPMYQNDTTNDYTGMMVLYENSNIIEVYVQKKRITTHPGFGTEGMWNNGNAVIGIQNATGTLASVPPGRNVLDPNWTATNEAWRFTPSGTSITSLKWFEGATATGPVIGTTPTLNVCPTATTTYTAEITYTLCNGTTLKETDQTTVTVAASKTWNGLSGTDWNTAANWTPAGVPVATEGVLIPNTTNKPIVTGGVNAVACSLTIQNGGILKVDPSNTITVTNGVSIAAGGDMIIENSGSLVQVNNSINSGIAHIKRTSAPMYRLDYTYWNTPVTAASAFTVGNLTSGTTNIYKYTPTVANGNGTWIQVGANTAMNPTYGIIARAPSTFPSTGTKQTHSVNFTGTPNNGNILMPIKKGTNANIGSTVPSGGSTAVTDADDEWNLIGNPYPSAIDIVSFLNLPANIPVVDGTVYVWTHNTPPLASSPDPFYGNYTYNYTISDYATFNYMGGTTTAGGTTPTQYIASGQSFFISADDTMANGTTANATFNNSMRVLNNNNGFYRSANVANNFDANEFNKQRLWLNLSNNNGGFSQILVGYAEGASLDWDRGLDGEALAGNAVKLYSLGADKKLTIQGRPWPFVQEDLVPLGFKATAHGNYTIGIDHLDAAFNNQNIYLEDRQLNIIHDLKSAQYSFTSAAGDFNERFVLRYTNNTLSNNDVTSLENSIIFYNDSKLNVKSTLEPIKEIVIHDVLGRILVKSSKVNANHFIADTLSPTQTTLIVKVTLENNVVVTKKVIY